MTKSIQIVLCGILIGGFGLSAASAALTIDSAAVSPLSTPAGVPATVTVTAVITDPSVIPNAVNLQRLDTAGRVVAVLGNLHDDGANGDAAANDKTFTLRITVLETITGPMTLRVSAAFRGTLLRVFSNLLVVDIVNPAASISSLSPNTGQAGQSVAVTITGSFTNFVAGSTKASFGSEISVGGSVPGALGPVTVTSPTGAIAQLTIEPGAAAGPRTVNVQTGIQEASLVGGFSVQALPQPVLISLTPNTGQQGQQNLSVNLTGQFTHFVQGTTTASFGAGITVASLTVNSATTATAVLNIDPAAATATRNITLTTGAEVVTLSNGFTVTAGVPLPVLQAPPVDQTVTTTLGAATDFLYTGPNAVQTGVAAGTINVTRAGVIRGKVITRDRAALPGVKITILNHPEFGQTLSRVDGVFDMAVNGGGSLIVSYEKSGLIPVQRQMNVPWQEFALAPDVIMIPFDTRSTVIDASSIPGGTLTAIQVARGTPVTDSDGTRQATLMFQAGVTATMVMPDGSMTGLNRLTVRATEYTVGPNGPQAMPADLPPASAYTYALEFSVDEAKAAGAIDVRFSPRLSLYVENFLGFPVGTTAPLGSYGRTQGVWIPAESGLVLKILSLTNGLANLDTNGDGITDGSAALAALSITDDERQQLAALYQPGQTLWRVLIPHFDEPWDVNWGFGLPSDAEPPDKDPEPDEPCESCQRAGNSTIEVQNQILGEAVGVVGTGLGLHYGSERVPGRKPPYTLEIPLSSSQLPPGVRRIELEVQVAGQLSRRTFPPNPNQRTTFTWDGKDAYGRGLQGTQAVTVRIGYTYPGDYRAPQKFGENAAGVVSGSRSRQEVTLWRTWRDRIGAWDARAVGLGGWTLSEHHVYDPGEQVLHRGDGGRQSTRRLGPTISTVAGTGGGCQGVGDGSPATNVGICPEGLAVGADGSLYMANPLESRVRRVAPDGIITTVAGNGNPCITTGAACGDGGPATQASLGGPFSIVVGPDNSLYIGEAQSGRALIRKVGPDGIINTFAGTGFHGFSGDGGPARLAQIGSALSLAVGPDGSLYTADNDNARIRRVAPDGIITTVAGTGTRVFSGDGGPATLAGLSDPQGVAVGQDGSIYIADTTSQRVRRITPDGIIRTIAGNGSFGFAGDGGPATAATLSSPGAVAVGLDDTVYIVDRDSNRVRWLRPDGTINTLAGNGFPDTAGDGGFAAQARLQDLQFGLAVGPDGSVYVAQSANNVRVRRIAPIAERFVAGGIAVPATDGTEVYLFTQNGRHLRTLDALTGAVRFQFAYDGAGRLATITDRDANVTTIERDAAGNPAAIVSPFGQRTLLTVSIDGYLTRVTNPAGETVQLAYSSDGLLAAFTKPGGQASHYTYDAQGRLIAATDPAGATTTLAHSGTNRSYVVTLTSALGRTTTYRVERLDTEALRMTSIDPAGMQIQAVIGQDGSQTATYPDGTVVHLVQGPDPRWGMQAPLAASTTETTPGGKTHTTTMQRSVTLGSSGDILNLRSLTETVTINGRVSVSAYDAATRTLTSTSPAGRRTSTVADDRGRPVRTQFGDLEPSSFTYDSRGRLASDTQGQGAGSRTNRYGYGSDGFLANITDALNQTGALATDANGRVIEETLPDGRQVRFAFDANSNVSTRTPPGRPAHTFDYTARDEVSAYTPPTVGSESGQIRLSYNADRQPVRADHPDSQAVQFQYDSSGRLGQVDLATGQRTYGYDAAGRPNTLGATGTTASIALSYAYDGELPTGTTWSGTVAGSVTRAYDNDFRITALSVNGSNPIGSIQYDADGLPIQVGVLTLTRAAQTGLVTATALAGSTDTTSYDSFGDASSYTASQGGTPIYSEQYATDSLGRLTIKTETTGAATRVFSYTYDLAGRLSEVRQGGGLGASYTYDANSNRLSVSTPGGTITATYDAQDRLIQYGATTYTHTPNGERQRKTAGGQTTTYRYDGPGNLTGVTLPNGTQIEYLLDGQGRRVGRRVNGALVQAFLYQDGLRPIAELDGAGTVISRFVYATQGSPDYMVKGGVTYRIIADHVGSPRLVIDATTGVVAQKLDYDEFGRVMLDTNPGFQPFGFAGGLYDQQTALVHFGAREYDPETGRWTTKDPIGFRGADTNLYAYAANDPVNDVDVTGLNTANTTLPRMCAVDPVQCAQLLAANGLRVAARVAPRVGLVEGGRRTAPYIPRVANVVSRGAQGLSNAVCRFKDTIQGLGEPSKREWAARQAAAIADRTGRAWDASLKGRGDFFWQSWIDASRNWRDYELTQEESREAVMWISRWAELLFGRGQ